MFRRSFIRSTGAAAAALAIAGCGGSAAAVITVTLAVAQAEGPAIYGALETLLPGILPKLPVASQSTAAAFLSTLEADVLAFGKIPAGASFDAAAQSVMADVSAILGLVSPYLPVRTLMAINAGVGLFSALLAGVASVTVPAVPVAMGAGVGAPAVVPGPIPIPLS